MRCSLAKWGWLRAEASGTRDLVPLLTGGRTTRRVCSAGASTGGGKLPPDRRRLPTPRLLKAALPLEWGCFKDSLLPGEHLWGVNAATSASSLTPAVTRRGWRGRGALQGRDSLTSDAWMKEDKARTRVRAASEFSEETGSGRK